jgi:hypothetical protein
MAIAALFESVSSAVGCRERTSEPMMSGAPHAHHTLNCVRCSTWESGGPPCELVPPGSHGPSVGQPTARKSGSMDAPTPAMLRVAEAQKEAPNAITSPTPQPPEPSKLRDELPGPHVGKRSLPYRHMWHCSAMKRSAHGAMPHWASHSSGGCLAAQIV